MMSSLTGSAKQIAWAEEIRAKALARAPVLLAGLPAACERTGLTADTQAAELLALVAQEPDSIGHYRVLSDRLVALADTDDREDVASDLLEVLRLWGCLLEQSRADWWISWRDDPWRGARSLLVMPRMIGDRPLFEAWR